MTTPDDHWPRLRQLFDQLAEVPLSEQAVQLDRLTAGDPWLRAEVKSLLMADRAAGDRFERLPEFPDDFGDDDQEDPVTGTRIGPYRIAREIGRGGMGAVYQAFRDDEAFTKRVAIKMVPVERVTDQVLRRFHHERQILARLEHKNIAALLDGGVTDDGRPWFAMECVEGERIDRYCERQRLGVRERIQLIRQVCAAVHYAHQNLVIHRDLKPSNVLVGPDGTVKLLDFGIAKLVDPEGPGEELTETGTLPMTTSYASPEQLRGETVSTATDIYSLGVLLYELLAGRPPFLFSNRPILEIRQRMLEETPVAPSQVGDAQTSPTAGLTRTMAGELDHIVLMALRKEPERRYPSAEQFSDDLLRFLAGQPVSAQPDSFGYRATKFAARNRAAVAAVAVVFLTLLGGLGVTLWQVRVGQRERARTEVINRFLQEVLLSSATDGRGDGGQRTISDALDAASERLTSEELSGYPEVKATLQQIIGTSYLSLGRYQEGEDHLGAALATQVVLFGDNNLETVKTLLSLAQLSLVKADYASAEGFFQRHLAGLRYERKRGRIVAATLVDALNNFALVRRARGNSEAAETLLHEALALGPEVPPESQGAVKQVETLLILTLLDRGKLAEAEADARKLLAEIHRRADTATAEMASSLTILGSVLMEQGQYPEAGTHLRQAEALYRRLYDANYVGTHDNLRLQAQLSYLEGRLAEGEAQIDRVLGNYRQYSSPQYISFATALTVKGLLLNAQGRSAEAERVLRVAVRLRSENLPPNHFMSALTTGALGEVLATARKFEEAEPLLLASHDALRRSQAVENPRTRLARQRLVDLYTAWGRADQLVKLR
jgi:serine/threonine-protein kinase